MADILNYTANTNPLSVTGDQVTRAPKQSNTTVATGPRQPDDHRWDNIAKAVVTSFQAASGIASAIREDAESNWRESVDDSIIAYDADNAQHKANIAAGGDPTHPEGLEASLTASRLAMTAQGRTQRSNDAHKLLDESIGDSNFSSSRKKYLRSAWGPTIMANTKAYEKVQLEDAKQTLERRYLKSFTVQLRATKDTDGKALDIEALSKGFYGDEKAQAYFNKVNATAGDKEDAFYSVLTKAVSAISEDSVAIPKLKESLDAKMGAAIDAEDPSKNELSPQFLKLYEAVGLKYKTMKTAKNKAIKDAAEEYLAIPENNDTMVNGKVNPDSKWMKQLMVYAGGKKGFAYTSRRDKAYSDSMDAYVTKSGLIDIQSGKGVNLSDYSGSIKKTFSSALEAQYRDALRNGKVGTHKFTDPGNISLMQKVVTEHMYGIHDTVDYSSVESVQGALTNQKSLMDSIRQYPSLMTDALRKDAAVYGAIDKYGGGGKAAMYSTYRNGKADTTNVKLVSSELKELDGLELEPKERTDAVNTWKLLKSLGMPDAFDQIEENFKPREVSDIKISSSYRVGYPNDDVFKATLKELLVADFDYKGGKLNLDSGVPVLTYFDKDNAPKSMVLDGFTETYKKHLATAQAKEQRSSAIYNSVAKIAKPAVNYMEFTGAAATALPREASRIIGNVYDFMSESLGSSWGQVADGVDRRTTSVGDYLIKINKKEDK